MGKDNTTLSSLFDDTRRMVSAFEGFTGPLDKVQSGDFQEALRLLHLAATTPMSDRELELEGVYVFLARLSPTEDSSHE